MHRYSHKNMHKYSHKAIYTNIHTMNMCTDINIKQAQIFTQKTCTNTLYSHMNMYTDIHIKYSHKNLHRYSH